MIMCFHSADMNLYAAASRAYYILLRCNIFLQCTRSIEKVGTA